MQCGRKTKLSESSVRRVSGGGRKEIKEEYSSCERASPGRPLLQCPLTDSLNVPGLLENDRKTSLQTYSSLLIHLDINEKQENCAIQVCRGINKN